MSKACWTVYMLGHEFFHEQAHLENNHELKRHILLLSMLLLCALIYRIFCHRQEYEADRLAAKKCGKKAAIESLKLLQMRENSKGRPTCLPLFSLHPKTKNRILHLR